MDERSDYGPKNSGDDEAKAPRNGEMPKPNLCRCKNQDREAEKDEHAGDRTEHERDDPTYEHDKPEQNRGLLRVEETFEYESHGYIHPLAEVTDATNAPSPDFQRPESTMAYHPLAQQYLSGPTIKYG